MWLSNFVQALRPIARELALGTVFILGVAAIIVALATADPAVGGIGLALFAALGIARA